MEQLFTARFLRTLNKLTPEIQSDVIKAIEEFKDKENHKKLRLHKLRGEMKAYHSFSANFEHRVIVKMVKTTVYFMDVGDHSVYD
jgi:mRNA-degrading endonuclease YafQ of YafQ-DinJ toxin-antitoxin module